jgi:hypothetical protein
MTDNFLPDRWTNLDSVELRLLLGEQIPGPGKYHEHSSKSNTLYLPLAGSSCRIVLSFRDKKIVAIEAGQAFDTPEWDLIGEKIEKSILVGPLR